MLNFFTRMLNNKKGFTLIEVLVVVAIIGILAALAAPRIIGRINDARHSHDVALARSLDGAVQQWVLDNEVSGGADALPAWEDLEEYLDNATWDYLTQTGFGEITETDTIADGDVIVGRFGNITVSVDGNKVSFTPPSR